MLKHQKKKDKKCEEIKSDNLMINIDNNNCMFIERFKNKENMKKTNQNLVIDSSRHFKMNLFYRYLEKLSVKEYKTAEIILANEKTDSRLFHLFNILF